MCCYMSASETRSGVVYRQVGNGKRRDEPHSEYRNGPDLGEQVSGFFLSRLPVIPADPDDDAISKSQLPRVAASASLLEAFKAPLREVNARFTRSELAISGWRSRETAYNMRQSSNRSRGDTVNRSMEDAVGDLNLQALETRMGGVAEKAMTPEGDIDLGRLTGSEAMRYFNALGAPIGGRR